MGSIWLDFDERGAITIWKKDISNYWENITIYFDSEKSTRASVYKIEKFEEKKECSDENEN